VDSSAARHSNEGLCENWAPVVFASELAIPAHFLSRTRNGARRVTSKEGMPLGRLSVMHLPKVAYVLEPWQRFRGGRFEADRHADDGSRERRLEEEAMQGAT
jgi:hypothetical protein